MLQVIVAAYKVNVILLIMISIKIESSIADEHKTTTISHGLTAGSFKDHVEEYFIEHKVSEKEAAISFQHKADDLLKRDPPAWCAPCTAEVKRYCLGNQMLQDHCCCDSRHGREQLPWLPHSCYVGEKCQPNIGSCIKYTELRECCCDREMAKQYKDIYSTSTRSHVAAILMIPLLLYLLCIRN